MQKAPHWDKRGRYKLPHRRDLSEALFSCGSVLTVRLFRISFLHCWLSFFKEKQVLQLGGKTKPRQKCLHRGTFLLTARLRVLCPGKVGAVGWYRRDPFSLRVNG